MACRRQVQHRRYERWVTIPPSRADRVAFGWVRSHGWAGIDISPFPKLAAWVERIQERPGAYAGVGIPTRVQKLTEEEEEAKAKEASEWIMKGMATK